MSRIQIEIFLGAVMILISGLLIVNYGLNEEERMATFELGQRAQAIEVGAELFEINCSGCHGPQGEGVPGLCPPLNDRYFFDQRLEDVKWSGSLDDYIVSTVSTGRLNSTRPELYSGGGVPAMPTWSEAYGGPLRDDQIRNIAQFVMNWEPSAPDRTQSTVPSGPSVGTDITVVLPEGDPVAGEALANSQGCVGCHISTNTGPAWLPTESDPGIGSRAETRLIDPLYTGNASSPEGYLLESIVLPNEYIVDGFVGNIMPGNYGDSLSAQDSADLLAYMLTLK